MTMIHWMNCLLLTYAPYFVLYKSSKMSEYSPLQSCIYAGIGFLCTQMAKIFVMATLLPVTSSSDDASFHWSHELGKTLVNAVEVLGMHLIITRLPKLSSFPAGVRISVVAIGWGFAEALVSYFIPLWIGARGTEFSWDYIEMGVEANLNIILHLSFIGAVWLLTRRDLAKSVPMGVVLASLVCVIHIALPSAIRHGFAFVVLGLSRWSTAGLRAGVALAAGILTKSLMAAYTPGSAKTA